MAPRFARTGRAKHADKGANGSLIDLQTWRQDFA